MLQFNNKSSTGNFSMLELSSLSHHYIQFDSCEQFVYSANFRLGYALFVQVLSPSSHRRYAIFRYHTVSHATRGINGDHWPLDVFAKHGICFSVRENEKTSYLPPEDVHQKVNVPVVRSVLDPFYRVNQALIF
jgi:hypothetical protein